MDLRLAAEIRTVGDGGARVVAGSAPFARNGSSLSLARQALRIRIAFLERTCDEAEAHRHWAIAARYAAALRDAREALIQLSPLLAGRPEDRTRR